jgi:hypothetical protein
MATNTATAMIMAETITTKIMGTIMGTTAINNRRTEPVIAIVD